jgi:hypothetical protein
VDRLDLKVLAVLETKGVIRHQKETMVEPEVVDLLTPQVVVAERGVLEVTQLLEILQGPVVLA